MNQDEISVNNHLQDQGKTEKRKSQKRYMMVLLVNGLIALILLAYGGMAIYYQSRFLPNTKINQVNCSKLDVASAAQLIEQQTKKYSLEVIGRDWRSIKNNEEQSGNISLGTVTAQDINFSFTDTEQAVQEVLKQQNSLLWIQAFIGNWQCYNIKFGYTFDESLLEKTVRGWEAFQSKNMIVPENATISEYSEKGYEIIPEKKGTQLDIPLSLESLKKAIYEGIDVVDLEAEECYKQALITGDNEKLIENCNMMNKWVNSSITYDWNGTEVIVNAEQINKWISQEKGLPVLDEEAVAGFVADMSKKLDTYGKKRKFTTALDVELTLPSGAYGWKTDRDEETAELLQLIYQGSVLEKEPIYTSKGAGKGSNDIGSSYVEADLSNQHLYLFQNGEIVLETDFVSGNMSKSGCMTPPGVFGLTYKTRNAVLRGDDYETPVNYWMPFNGNVGMHDATWRNSFGGSIYLTSGSHGCINLPLDKAEAIYDYVFTGFPVICYYY